MSESIILLHKKVGLGELPYNVFIFDFIKDKTILKLLMLGSYTVNMNLKEFVDYIYSMYYTIINGNKLQTVVWKNIPMWVEAICY